MLLCGIGEYGRGCYYDDAFGYNVKKLLMRGKLKVSDGFFLSGFSMLVRDGGRKILSGKILIDRDNITFTGYPVD